MDEAILQDIHCVASLLKMYFRELPNPLLTFHLYDKFVNAVQAEEDIRLLKLRDVVQQLPPPHYRSLEYLMRHLSKVAAHGSQTGMTPKNVAIVWAPNLLRSREIENGGVGALHVVGVQAVLTEYLIRYSDIIFSEKMPVFPSPTSGEETPKKTRPKSLAISTPTKLLSLEEARSRALASNFPMAQPKFIEVGGGVDNLPPKYHTVIDVPGRHSGGKGKKSPLGWRSFFSRGWHTTSGRSKARRAARPSGGQRPKISSPVFVHHAPLSSQEKAVTESEVCHINPKKLRTVKSAESLLLLTAAINHSSNTVQSTSPMDQTACCAEASTQDHASHQKCTTSSEKSLSYQKHFRSTSHDSYFEHVIDSSVYREQEGHAAPKRDEAHKPKLVSFETGVSSPKVQKLNLKRLYHTLGSPPMARKKSASEVTPEAEVKHRKSRRTHFAGQQSLDEPLQVDRPTTAVLPSVNYLQSENFVEVGDDDEKTRPPSTRSSVDTDVEDSSCAAQATSQTKDDLARASMEATISEVIGVSQLLSFESKAFSPNNKEDQDTCNALSAMPMDSSFDTQDSLTTDNISDMPSSCGSEFSSSPADGERLESHLVPSCSAEASAHNGLHEAAVVSSRSVAEIHNHKPPRDDEDLAKQTSELQINMTASSVAATSPPDRFMLVSPCVDENLILSPPENFVDNKSPKDPSQDFVPASKSSEQLSKHRLESYVPLPKMATSGSLFQSVADVPRSNKKRSNDRISPISPVEESRRRFESEIGRLIVRDRQMRLEMEQMKAERQKCSFKPEPCKKSCLEVAKGPPKIDKKFSGILEAKKSPAKKPLDAFENLTTTKDSQDSKLSDWSSLYRPYLRMEKKPSVKELLSKFEVQQTNESAEPSSKDKDGVFTNIQVVYHDFSKEICTDFSQKAKIEGSQVTQNRDHIFQTECVVRFPHPKTAVASDSVSPQRRIDASSPFLSSYLRSKAGTSPAELTASSGGSDPASRTCDTLDKARAFGSSGENSATSSLPGDVGRASNSWQFSAQDDTKPSVKLKKKFLEDFAVFADGGEPRTTGRRTRPSPSKQRPRSVPPPLCRFSAASRPLPEPVPKPASSQAGPRPIRERAALFERSFSFSGYGDRKALSAAASHKGRADSQRRS